MKLNSLFSTLTIAIAVFLVLMVSIPSAFAKTVNINGSSSGSFVTTYFTWENPPQGGWALSNTFTGADNLGGQFTGQTVMQFEFTGGHSCLVSPDDDSYGWQFYLLPVSGAIKIGNGVLNYQQGQLYLRSRAGSPSASEGCINLDTGAYRIDVTYDVVGGTGKYAGVTGEQLTSTITGTTLAAPKAMGGYGQFGAFQAPISGTVTY